MNLLQIAGHLAADPETRFTPNGQKVTTFRTAVNGKKGGKEFTMWWRVTVWGENRLLPYLKKGSAVIVVGEMHKPEIYTDKEGRPQVSLEMTAEVVRFSPFGKGERTGEQQQQGNMGYGTNSGYNGGSTPQSYANQSATGGFESNEQPSYQSFGQFNSDFKDDEEIPF